MSEVRRGRVERTARLAALPLGYAGRTAAGLGRRIAGAPAEQVAAAVAQQTAEQLFQVLGELKGGAMKVGQALSIFEAAMPEELAAPYRSALTKLQDSAPSMPASVVVTQLEAALGPDWQERLVEFDPKPAAAASIGQVHRGRWLDGREVAVKVQYPGVAQALASDLRQLAMVAKVAAPLRTGIDAAATIGELQARVLEEVDYRREADAQARFAEVFAGSEFFAIPEVVEVGDGVLVTTWLDGTPLSQIIAGGSREQRDAAAAVYVDFLLAGPDHVGLLHADPHPGNFRLLADGRLGVLDFGAVGVFDTGLPPALGRIVQAALDTPPRAVEVREGLHEEGFLPRPDRVDPEELLAFLDPLLAPLHHDAFEFSRDFLRGAMAHISELRWQRGIVKELALPPEYLLIHRVWAGGLGVLSQIGGTVTAREILSYWLDDLDLGPVGDGSAAG